ncbi:MAG: phosphatidylserine decarboxylase family protein [Bacteroidia bacterium]
MMLHREGKNTIILTLLFLVILNGTVYFIFPGNEIIQNIFLVISIIFMVIILQFFRNPIISAQQNEKHVLSPADGKVVVIEEVLETEYFNEKRIQISVFMSPFNVHVNRNPIGGIVKFYRYHKGKYLVAFHPKSSLENERTTVVIENKNGVSVLFRQIAGALARRIVCYLREGVNVEQGNEMGFIKFGSRVDIFIPLNSKVNVKLNEAVKGGKTVLAEI